MLQTNKIFVRTNKPLFIYLIFILIYCQCSDNQLATPKHTKEEQKDSLSIWLKKSRNTSLSPNARYTFLNKAIPKIAEVTNDSLKSKYLSKIPYAYYKLNDSLNFNKAVRKALDVAITQKDSLSIADLYWDLANNNLHNKKQMDSAFYYFNEAQQIFEALDDHANSGKMLFFMAIVQKNVKDFTTSEATTIKAIEKFKQVDEDYPKLYGCYNNLGIIFNQLEEYDRSLYYHNKALEYLPDNDLRSYVVSLNNIGVVYKNKKEYEEAINYFEKGLNTDSLYYKHPKDYAMLLDNLAYTKFKLNDTTALPKLFYDALKIKDSLQLISEQVISNIHLSEYYLSKKDTNKAITLAKEAKKMALATTNNVDLLDAYLLLINIDEENSAMHSSDYIALSQKLQKQDRSVRNKFARIQYETDEFITENQRLSQRQYWLTLIVASMLVIGILLFVVRTQMARNKELKFEKEQQQANEEIFNLMLQQQSKIDEGRQKEKERISEELHDGVLGRLFGTRLSLGSLNNKGTEEAKSMREHHINELKSIEEEIRNISHELSLDIFNSEVSFITMVNNLLDDQSKISNFKYHISNDSEIVWEEIPSNVKINLYRIIQEAIQNINKYANATTVDIAFEKRNEFLVINVSDDGVGFNVERSKSGIGIKNMKSRVKKIKGHIEIKSNTNQGTSIIIDVPFKLN